MQKHYYDPTEFFVKRGHLDDTKGLRNTQITKSDSN